MTKRYLRHKNDGSIYERSEDVKGETLAAHPLMEEVSEEIAFPERFKPVAYEGRKPAVDIDALVKDTPSEQPYTSPELAADASRRLKK